MKHKRRQLALLELLVAACFSYLVALSSSRLHHAVPPEPVAPFLRIIVVGATGDLAAKYLWTACFRVALEARLSQNQSVRFIAAARDPSDVGNQWMRRHFTPEWGSRLCGENASRDETPATCRAFFEQEFVPSIVYTPLTTRDHYKSLSTTLADEDKEDNRNGRAEQGRLIYLAIPPRAFLHTSRLLHKYLRPTAADAFFRVVIEKPFGRDLASAATLATGLRGVLKDNEMLLMDHYAGKLGLRVIDPFVRMNAATLAPVWNGRHIREISIFMSETETCEHRLAYFDSIGIIRDVMANHLQLLLGAVVAPSLDGLGPRELTAFLHSLRPKGTVVVGQYRGYNTRGGDDGNATSTTRSSTATAAFAAISSTLETWNQTRIVFAAAKATDRRKADVLVTFHRSSTLNDHGAPCTVRFTIQDGALSGGERIDVKCASLGALKIPVAWQQMAPGRYTPQPSDASRPPRPAWQLGNPISAYDTLLQDAVHGRVNNFMAIDDVLASWKLWSPIVLAAERSGSVRAESMVMYPVGAKSWMDFGGRDQWQVEGALNAFHEGICPRVPVTKHYHTLGVKKSSP